MPDQRQLPRSFSSQTAEHWRTISSSAPLHARDTHVIAGESVSKASRFLHEQGQRAGSDHETVLDPIAYCGLPHAPGCGGNSSKRGSGAVQLRDDRKYPTREKDRRQEGSANCNGRCGNNRIRRICVQQSLNEPKYSEGEKDRWQERNVDSESWDCSGHDGRRKSCNGQPRNECSNSAGEKIRWQEGNIGSASWDHGNNDTHRSGVSKPRDGRMYPGSEMDEWRKGIFSSVKWEDHGSKNNTRGNDVGQPPDDRLNPGAVRDRRPKGLLSSVSCDDRSGNSGTCGSDVGQPRDDQGHPVGEKHRLQEGILSAGWNDRTSSNGTRGSQVGQPRDRYLGNEKNGWLEVPGSSVSWGDCSGNIGSSGSHTRQTPHDPTSSVNEKDRQQEGIVSVSWNECGCNNGTRRSDAGQSRGRCPNDEKDGRRQGTVSSRIWDDCGSNEVTRGIDVGLPRDDSRFLGGEKDRQQWQKGFVSVSWNNRCSKDETHRNDVSLPRDDSRFLGGEKDQQEEGIVSANWDHRSVSNGTRRSYAGQLRGRCLDGEKHAWLEPTAGSDSLNNCSGNIVTHESDAALPGDDPNPRFSEGEKDRRQQGIVGANWDNRSSSKNNWTRRSDVDLSRDEHRWIVGNKDECQEGIASASWDRRRGSHGAQASYVGQPRTDHRCLGGEKDQRPEGTFSASWNERGGNDSTHGSDAGRAPEDFRYPSGEKDQWQEGIVSASWNDRGGSKIKGRSDVGQAGANYRCARGEKHWWQEGFDSESWDGRGCSADTPVDQVSERSYIVARSDHSAGIASQDTNSINTPANNTGDFERRLNYNSVDAPALHGQRLAPEDYGASRLNRESVALETSSDEMARCATGAESLPNPRRQQLTKRQSREINRHSDARTRSPLSQHTRHGASALRDSAPKSRSNRHRDALSHKVKPETHQSPSCGQQSHSSTPQSASATEVPPQLVARSGTAPVKQRIFHSGAPARPKSWAEQQAVNRAAKMQLPPDPTPCSSRRDTTKSDALIADAAVQKNVVPLDAARPLSLKTRDKSLRTRRPTKKKRKWQRAAGRAAVLTTFPAPMSPAQATLACNDTRGKSVNEFSSTHAVAADTAYHVDACSANIDKVFAEMDAWGQHFMTGLGDDFVQKTESAEAALLEEQTESAVDVAHELAFENDDEVPIPDDDPENSKYWIRVCATGGSFLLCSSPAEREFLERCTLDRIEKRKHFFARVHSVARFCSATRAQTQKLPASAHNEERECRDKDHDRGDRSVVDDRRAVARKRGLVKRAHKTNDHTGRNEETGDDPEREDTEDEEVDSPVVFQQKNDFKAQDESIPCLNSVAYYLGRDADDGDYDGGLESEEGDEDNDCHEEVEKEADGERSEVGTVHCNTVGEEVTELEAFAFDDVSTSLIPSDASFLANTENGTLADPLRDRCNNVFSDWTDYDDESNSYESESNPDADHYDWETWANGQVLEEDLEKSKEANFKQFRSDANAYGAVLRELLVAGVDPNFLDDILAARAARSRSVSSASCSRSRSVSRSCLRSTLRSRSSSRLSSFCSSFSRSSHFCRSDNDVEPQTTGHREPNSSNAPAVCTVPQNNESRSRLYPQRKASEPGRRDGRKSERRWCMESPRRNSRALRRSEARRGYSSRRSPVRREYWNNGHSRRKEEGDWISVKPTEILFTQSTICTRFRDGKRILRCIDNPKELVDGGLRAIRYNGKLMTLSNRRLALFRLLELKGLLTECKAFLLRKIPHREFASKFTTTCGGRYVEMRNKDRDVFGMTRAETTYIQREEILQRRRLENESAPKTGLQRHKQLVLASEDAVQVVQKNLAALKSKDVTIPAPEPQDASATASSAASTAPPIPDPAPASIFPRSAFRRRPRSRTPRGRRVASATPAPARARPSWRAATPPRHGDLPSSPPQTLSATQRANTRPARPATTTPRSTLPESTVPRTALAATTTTVPQTVATATTTTAPRTVARRNATPAPQTVQTPPEALLPRIVTTASTSLSSNPAVFNTTKELGGSLSNTALQMQVARASRVSRLSAAAALRAQRGIVPKAARRRLLAAAGAATSLSGSQYPTIGKATSLAGSPFPPTPAVSHLLYNVHQSSSNVPAAGPQIVTAPIPTVHHNFQWQGLRSIPTIVHNAVAQSATAYTDAAQNTSQPVSTVASPLHVASPERPDSQATASRRGPARRRVLPCKTRAVPRQRVVGHQNRRAAASPVTAKMAHLLSSPKKQRLSDQLEGLQGNCVKTQNVNPNAIHAAPASKTSEHSEPDSAARTRNAAAERRRSFVTPRTVRKTQQNSP